MMLTIGLLPPPSSISTFPPGTLWNPQHVRLFVRIYRDYSIADFVFVTLATLGATYTTFSSSYVRSTVCEEFSRHPELMRDMGEMGLSLENCEQWFERAVVAVLGIMFILIVVRVSPSPLFLPTPSPPPPAGRQGLPCVSPCSCL